MDTIRGCSTTLVTMRPIGSAEQLEKRRRKAIALLRAGQTYREVAQTTRASLSSVVRWTQAYRRDRRHGLSARPTPGRPPRLTVAQRERLRRYLLAGARAAGYTTELWTLKRIAKLIETRFGIHYSLVGVWSLLRHGLHWSSQKPERRALQRDERAIDRWKRTTWPNIKKRRSTWGPSRVPR
jgi:transposase